MTSFYVVAVWGLEHFAFSIICENRVRSWLVIRKILPCASQNDQDSGEGKWEKERGFWGLWSMTLRIFLPGAAHND